jgi:hypothetical protein
MRRYRFRFISGTYGIVFVILILLPAAGVSYLAWDLTRDSAFRRVEREQREIAGALLDVVRARYDIIQNYQFHKEQALRKNLTVLADTLHRTARELELEAARRNLSLGRAQDVFLNIVTDMSQKQNFQISIIDTKGETVYCPMLPKGFDLFDNPWIQTMLETDAGEVQFTWRYPGEAEMSDRILMHRLIHGWGWIIAVESVMEDPLSDQFADHQYRGLQDYISSYHASAGGIAMILSPDENRIIAHPEMRSGSLDNIPGISKMTAARSGAVRYRDEYGFNRKAWVEFFSPLKWIIVVTAREDQISYEADRMVKKLAGVSAGLGFLVCLLFYRIQRAIIFRAMSRRRSSIIDME